MSKESVFANVGTVFCLFVCLFFNLETLQGPEVLEDQLK